MYMYFDEEIYILIRMIFEIMNIDFLHIPVYPLVKKKVWQNHFNYIIFIRKT